MSMAEKSRKYGQPPFDIFVGPIPMNQGVQGESMTKIVNARSGVVGWPAADYVLPLETSQRPLFERLGTPRSDKRHAILDAGHTPLPRGDMVRETLDWLDRYLGPVTPTQH